MSDSPLPSEITPQAIYFERRRILAQMGWGVMGALGASASPPAAAGTGQKLTGYATTAFGRDEKLTAYDNVTTYNNFYEFGTDKEDPSSNAGTLKTRPWTLTFEGALKRPKQIGIDDLLRLFPQEERIYRMRCVEAWSMVIPWVGLPLQKLIQWAEPTAQAKYVEFISLADPAQMPGLRRAVLDWPYNEGLRMDEAQHPLTLMAVGLYGEVLPHQNGAPIRLVVPWKYGFKSIKSIVKIRFRETMPNTSWMKANASEYGFYSNVNPAVDHPRWSQATERRIGGGLFEARRKTLPFNGYAEEVASLYSGMDLKKYF